MTVRLTSDGTIELHGDCPIEDVEPLMRLVAETAGAPVDWRACDQAHAAVVQFLLVAKPRLLGPPRGAFLKEHIAPLFVGSTA